MSEVFRKLNLKAQDPIVVLDAPPSFEPELAQLRGVAVLRAIRAKTPVTFALGFAITQRVLDTQSAAMAAAAAGDAVLWIAYPKLTSRTYRCEFNRDSGWTVFAAAGFESVRMVAIDADWSALRFRRSPFVKSTRRE